MKKGKMRNKNYFVFVFVFLFLVGLFSVGYFSGFFEMLTGKATSGYVGLNVTIAAFYITTVYNTSLGPNLNSGPNPTSFIINFTVYDGAGSAYLNDTTAVVNLTLAGEITRYNSSCIRSSSNTTNANYSCNVTMFWYDAAGGWNITAYMRDNYSNFVMNGSNTLTIAALTGFDMAQTNLSWASMAAGATNQTSTNDPLTMNNTGNQNIGASTGNITINASHLFGESNSAYSIRVGNVTVSSTNGTASCVGTACLECDHYGFPLLNTTYVNITKSNLTKGNYTVNDGTGQEWLFFCIKSVGSDLTQQAYSTAKTGVWTIKIP